MTRRIQVGAVPVGGGAPVSIQSMCNTATEDVEATVQQIRRLEQAGCDIVRVAVPTEEAARAIPAIKRGIRIPLVADIHFDYKLALLCIDGGVDKIRINPGNIGAKERVRAVAGRWKRTFYGSTAASPPRRWRRARWGMCVCWRTAASGIYASP